MIQKIVTCYQRCSWWLWTQLVSDHYQASLCSFELIHHISQDYLHPMNKMLHGAPDQRWLMVISYVFHCTNGGHIFTELLADGLLAHSSLVQLYSLALKLILWAGVFYTHIQVAIKSSWNRLIDYNLCATWRQPTFGATVSCRRSNTYFTLLYANQ